MATAQQNPIKEVAYWVVTIIGCGYLGYLGSTLLQPLVFALIFALFLYPVDKFFSKKISYRWLSIILSFFAVLVPITGVGLLFSFQLVDIVDSLPAIGSTLEAGVQKVLTQISNYLPFIDISKADLLSSQASGLLEGPLSFIRSGLMSSTAILVGVGLVFIYTFLILYYRWSLANFVIFYFEKSHRPEIRETLSQIKETVQAYIGGLGLVMIFLAVINSIGLYIIGVPYAIFWGTLAGLLAVIPYIGTALGGLLPFLYSLATSDSFWQPVAVVFFYMFIQFLEGNLITPKIVGSKVNINPLFAIVALVFFGQYWGVGGVILALPIISVIRIILSQFDETEPIAVLMSSDVADKSQKFKKLADD